MTGPPLVLHGGVVWWTDSGRTYDAVAMVDEKFVAVGEAGMALGDRDAGFRDVTGQFVMPAFGDGHAHLLVGCLESEGPAIRERDSMAGIVAEAGPLEGADLLLDRPARHHRCDQGDSTPLAQCPQDRHVGTVGNLAECRVRRGLVNAHKIQRPGNHSQRVVILSPASNRTVGHGFVQPWVEPNQLDGFLAAAEQNRLPIRFHLALYADPRSWLDQLDQLIEGREHVRRPAHPWLTADTVKFCADSVVENATADLFEPDTSEPEIVGFLVWSRRGGHCGPRDRFPAAHPHHRGPRRPSWPRRGRVRRAAAGGFGSDWPVSEADPLVGLAAACSRQTDERAPAQGWTPAERLSVDQALEAYTAGVAHQPFRHAGTLRPGSDTDLVVLSIDPYALQSPRDLDTVRVLSTWLAGEYVYEAKEITDGRDWATS